jgi:hypothetical protein
MPWLGSTQHWSKPPLPLQMLRIACCVGIGVGAVKTGTSTDPIDGVLVMIYAAGGLLSVDAATWFYAGWVVRRFLKPEAEVSQGVPAHASGAGISQRHARSGLPIRQEQSKVEAVQPHRVLRPSIALDQIRERNLQASRQAARRVA